MRGDGDLIREHAEEKARQSVRLAAARRIDTSDPRQAILRSAMGGISGTRTVITLLILSVAVNAVFVAVGLGLMGGLRRALFGGIFWVPLIIAPLAVLFIDRRGMAGWKIHMLLGLIATGMLMGVPVFANLFISLLVPTKLVDYEILTNAMLYMEYFVGFLPLYALALAILAAITGVVLAFWDKRAAG